MCRYMEPELSTIFHINMPETRFHYKYDRDNVQVYGTRIVHNFPYQSAIDCYLQDA